MSELTKKKNSIDIECDCGIIHKLTRDKEDNLILKSIGGIPNAKPKSEETGETTETITEPKPDTAGKSFVERLFE